MERELAIYARNEYNEAVIYSDQMRTAVMLKIGEAR